MAGRAVVRGRRIAVTAALGFALLLPLAAPGTSGAVTVPTVARPATAPAAVPATARSAADGAALDALIPTAASLGALASSLPADPVDAAETLVADIMGADDARAVAATGELLRRTGVPLVSAAGPVIAVPDGLTIISDPVDVELLPMLTRAVRTGMIYTPEQVSQTLRYLGVTTRAWTDAELIGTLAQWGKTPGAPEESVTAGAAVRALARAHGELLVPAALVDASTLQTLASNPNALTAAQQAAVTAPGRLTGLDPLQVALLVAQAAGDVTGPVTASGPSASPPGLRATASSSLCDSLAAIGDTGKELNKTAISINLKQAAEDAKEGLGETVEAGFSAYDKGADVLTTLLLLNGAQLDLIAYPDTTHFRHTTGDISRDVTFIANATFNSSLAAEHLKCWQFAGLDLPPNGPMSGFRIWWEVFGGIPVLQAKETDSDKLQHGELTNQGVSTLQMYPRTEKHPPKNDGDQPQATADEIVTASMDKDDFPLKFSDLIGLATSGPEAAALAKAWSLAVTWMQKVGLPTRRLKYPVTYHATSPYVIQGKTDVQAIIAQASLAADLYSCGGPGGPWKGTITLSGEAGAPLIAAAKIAGATVDKTTGAVTVPVSFTLDPTTSRDQTIPLFTGIDLLVNLDPGAIKATEEPQSAGDTFDRLNNRAVIGDASYRSGGEDMRTVMHTYGQLITGADMPVVGVIRDGRCPGATYWDDPFDGN